MISNTVFTALRRSSRVSDIERDPLSHDIYINTELPSTLDLIFNPSSLNLSSGFSDPARVLALVLSFRSNLRFALILSERFSN